MSAFHEAVYHLRMTPELFELIVKLTCEHIRLWGAEPTPEDIMKMLLTPSS